MTTSPFRGRPLTRCGSSLLLPLMDESNVVGLGVGGGEAEQSGALTEERGAILLRHWLQGLDEESRAVALPRDLPEPANSSIDEHGRLPQVGDDPFAVILGDDAAAVGVGDEHVVELSQKTRRGGRV